MVVTLRRSLALSFTPEARVAPRTGRRTSAHARPCWARAGPALGRAAARLAAVHRVLGKGDLDRFAPAGVARWGIAAARGGADRGEKPPAFLRRQAVPVGDHGRHQRRIIVGIFHRPGQQGQLLPKMRREQRLSASERPFSQPIRLQASVELRCRRLLDAVPQIAGKRRLQRFLRSLSPRSDHSHRGARTARRWRLIAAGRRPRNGAATSRDRTRTRSSSFLFRRRGGRVPVRPLAHCCTTSSTFRVELQVRDEIVERLTAGNLHRRHIECRDWRLAGSSSASSLVRALLPVLKNCGLA